MFRFTQYKEDIMTMVSLEHRFMLLAKLSEHMDWDSLTMDHIEVGMREVQRAGVEVTALIRNGFRMKIDDFFHETENLALQIPSLPRPTLAELQSKFGWIKRIERDTSPTNAVILNLGTVLNPHEQRISGTEYERRIVPNQDILLGYQHAVWLVEHQDEFPMFMNFLGRAYIDFLGIVATNADNGCYYPSLSQHDSRWYLCRHRVELNFARYGRLAVSGK